MKQLTLENIAWYLPDGFIATRFGNWKATIKGCFQNELGDLFLISENETSLRIDDECRIYLRPMSDLTKTFIKDGEETTHLQELARIEGFFTEGHKFKLNDYNLYSLSQGRFKFMYRNYSFNLWIDETPTIIENQLQLFTYLAKHKFDFQNLITEGLAIDANTLQTNPYL